MNLLPCLPLTDRSRLGNRSPDFAGNAADPLAALCERVGADVLVKHENQTPIGAFKIRGSLFYFSELRRKNPEIKEELRPLVATLVRVWPSLVAVLVCGP